MAANDINLKINLDDYGSVSTIGELKKQLKELKSAALEAGEGSAAFNQISQKAGELNDKITRVNENIRANTGSAVENATRGFANIASVGVGAFSAVQGAMAVFGVESEDLQKTLVKLNGAMALAQGLKSLAEAPDIIRDSISAIKSLTIVTKANELVTFLASAAQTAFAAATGGVVLSMNALKIAIASTGIGLLIVGVGMLASAMMDLASDTDNTTDSIDDLNSSLENFKSNQEAISLGYDADIESIKIQIDQLKLRGASLDEIQKKELDLLDTESKKVKLQSENDLKARDTNARQIDLLRAKDKKNKLDKDELKTLDDLLNKQIVLDAAFEKSYKTVTEILPAKRNLLIEAQAKQSSDAINKKAEEDAKKQDERNKKAAEAIRKHLEDIKNIKDRYLTSDRDRIAKQFDDDIAKLNKKNKDELELINKVEEAKLKALSEYDDKLASKRLQDSSNLLIALAGDDQSRLNAEKKMVDDTIALNETVSKSGKKVYEELGMSADEWALKKLDLQKKVDDGQKKLDAENLKRINDDKIALDDVNVIAIEREGKKLEAIGKLNEDFFKREEDALLKSLTTKRDIELQQKDLTEAQIKLINEKYAKDKEDLEKSTSDKINEIRNKQIESEKALNDARLQIATQTLNSLSSLNDLFYTISQASGTKDLKQKEKNAKAAFAVNKALTISSTVITGIFGVQAALTPDPKGLIPEPFATALRIANAASIGAAAIANVAKIASTKFDSTSFNAGDSGGGGGGGGGANGSQQPSTFTAPQFFGLGNQTNPNGGNQPSPLQVYVLENDITNAQQNVLGYIQTSVLTLGQPENSNGPLGPQ